MTTRTSTVTGHEPLPLSLTAEPASRPDGGRPQDLEVQLMYLKDDPLYRTAKPIQVTPFFADRQKKTNVKLEPGSPEILHDVRGLGGQALGDFSLDQHGFKYVKAPTAFRNWSSQPDIAAQYLPELENLLRSEVEGCDEILFYDARLRQDVGPARFTLGVQAIEALV